MLVWPDGTVTGSVNNAELDLIHATLKGVGKRKLAALGWQPVENNEQLVNLLDGTADDDDPEPEPTKAAKASTTKKET